MIQNIGMSRVVVVALLLLLNAALIGATYFYVAPMDVKKERELRSSKGAVQARYGEITQLREDFALLKDRLTEFSFLEVSGFFDNQNKVFAEAKGNELAIKSNLTGSLSVKPAETIVDPRADEAGHVLLRSPVVMEVGAQDDLDVMYFIKLMQERFPGVLELQSLELTRVKNLDATVLRQIGSGGVATLVEANITMDWITMPNKENLN